MERRQYKHSKRHEPRTQRHCPIPQDQSSMLIRHITSQGPNNTLITSQGPNNTLITSQGPNNTLITSQGPNNTLITKHKQNLLNQFFKNRLQVITNNSQLQYAHCVSTRNTVTDVQTFS